MKKIRVLVVDDSVVIRRLVSDILAGDPALDVVGVAANGKIALERIPQVNPDVVTLDIEMPIMDGIETLAEIRKQFKDLPVIMFSTLTERGAAVTLDALSMGASDYVTKPANVGSTTAGMARVREEIIPKIKALCRRGVREVLPSSPVRMPAAAKCVPLAPLAAPKTIEVVGVGVSTGGPNALAEIIPSFPADFPVPIVIVQHMPPVFTKLLAERLNSKAHLQVEEAADGITLRPGFVWIAPGDYHMTVEPNRRGHCLRLHQGAPENSCRPAVDVLFRSLAQCFAGATLATVLTGMGQDGLRGCELVHAAGGQILAQDEASSVVWGMPGFVAKAGLAQRVLPLKQVVNEIVQRVDRGRRTTAAVR